MSKKIYVIMFLFICLVILMSCDSEERSEETQPLETVSFRITWKVYSGRGETIGKIVDQFNLNQTRYQIELLSGDEDLDVIEESLVNDAIDIYVLPYRYVKLFGKKNMLSTLEAEYVDPSVVYPSIMALGEVDGIKYGVPWVSHSMALLYNKDLLEKAGVDPDSIVNRKSFEEALESVSNQTDSDGIGLVGQVHNDLSWMVNQFIYGSGNQLIENDKIALNNAAVKEDLLFYRDVLGQYAQATWQEDTGTEVMSYFREQKVAFEIQGLWGVTDIWKNGNPFEVGIIPLSRIDANAEVGPMMLVMGDHISGEKLDFANGFFEYLLSLEAQEAIMHGEYSPEKDRYYPFRLPIRKDIIDSDVFEPYQMFEVFIEAYDTPSIDVPVAEWLIIKEAFYTPYLHQVMMHEMTIDEFLKQIEIEGNTILDGGL